MKEKHTGRKKVWKRNLKRRIFVFSVFAFSALFVPLCGASAAGRRPSFSEIKKLLPARRGVAVVLEDHGLRLTRRFVNKTDFLIYVQFEAKQEALKARALLSEMGPAGRRVSVDFGPLSRLFLSENLTDIVIAPAGLGSEARKEILRVLHPGGIALIGERNLRKPVPQGVDDWSHPYHGPDNNPQSEDRIARAPYLTHFLADPRYGPLPQVAVASAGRLFKAYGHIAFKKREEPLLNTLVAYNAYNGAELWRRPLVPGIMIHRNTMIATPEVLYVGDDKSCKVLDAATGELRYEIKPPSKITGGTFWKWMALQDGVLYAMVGKDEPRDPVVRQRRNGHGWPWYPLSPGFNRRENPWGYGKTVLALDPKSGEIKWVHKEPQEIDARGICLKDDCLFLFRFGSFLTCLDPADGAVKWRKSAETDPAFFKALGRNLNRQDWRTNWRTTVYAKTDGKVLFLAGPMFEKLFAISARDGSILWTDPYDNYQLVLRREGLFGISGPWGKIHTRCFDPLSGKVLGVYAVSRRACTRPCGSIDAIFFRAMGGTVRLDVASGTAQWVSPMRAQCHDGVTIANGLLYWWPSVCDCQLTLYGITCLGPAGDFDFTAKAREEERLERRPAYDRPAAGFQVTGADWPVFRHDPEARGTSSSRIASKAELLWKVSLPEGVVPTAPVTAGGYVFVAGSDGSVRALSRKEGKQLWIAFTGGPIRLPPACSPEGVFVGSYDGWIYSFDPEGRLRWRFRGAPRAERIPVYGRLVSRWPAASGVVVRDGVLYAACGIVNYDGTYVYALDARSGKIRWQNTTSGHLDPEVRAGVSVQGHLLVFGGKLYLAGGNAVSPAIYDLGTGRCLNAPAPLKACASIYPRGWELSVVGTHVVALGQPFYRHPRYRVYDPSCEKSIFHFPGKERDIVWLDKRILRCYPKLKASELDRCITPRRFTGHMIPPWGKLRLKEKPYWEVKCEGSRAVAVGSNAACVSVQRTLRACELASGKVLWEKTLPARAVPWGLAVDRNGNVIVSLENGSVLCFGGRF